MKKLTRNWWKVSLVVGLSLGVCANAAIAGEGPGGGKKAVKAPQSNADRASKSVATNIARERVGTELEQSSDQVRSLAGSDPEFVQLRAEAAKAAKAPAKVAPAAKASNNQPVLLTK